MEKQRGKVLVTPRSLSRDGHPGLQLLVDEGFEVLMPWPGKQPNEGQLLEVLPACVAYLAGVEPIGERVLAACPELKVISRNGVGMDNVDLAAAERLGIKVVGTPGANSQGVAELALALLFDGMRAVSYSDLHMKEGQWSRRKGFEVTGKTLGIIGCGNIGQRLARMAIGVGMRVLAYDVYKDANMEKTPGFSYTELNHVLSGSDMISLHCPPGKKPLLDAQALSTMRKGVVIVNTARDALVDHAAMLEALESGQVTTYATDVYDKEPPELDALLKHEKVVMTPHIGGFTEESVERATIAAVQNILQAIG
ncbi:phosphoglycerate dehydrogenase [Pleomorphochaeta sp. DL1XJH-081]|uniref:phosphoglycerate dehydrogenase n=1 Tax=Pleomorphochaeta sp. DL1XJH-081 TaxID=3409690 RepID=UPI003BB50108